MNALCRAIAAFSLAALALSGCGGSASPFVGPPTPVTAPTPVPAGQAGVRAIHGSPNAPNVDIYVYTTGAPRPATPAISNLAFKSITPYAALNAGAYTIDVEAAGAASTTTPVASENVNVVAGTYYSIAVAGEVGSTLQFVNFVEPALTTGQSALVVHHASPFVGAAVNPVGVGVYDASAVAVGALPAPNQTTQLFSFAFTPGTSGPATSGAMSGGEYFISPVPTGLPADLGLAAGAAGTNGGTLASVAVGAPLSSIVANTPNFGTTAHISIFAIDASATSATLIGAQDP